ncbi:GGDEF domain-containing protein [Caballeronia zhejiangensis]|uniref:diguanylate cyclase n=1 Tax=Caballeronia zhejiangensis TaxID=871203 RepID=A0A656QL09_9BURK|nr:GGDEF domain-containing protein [Caballeronia zhejiangensis]KDR31936.1 diguanylate cyclase [Caballeronia zhejiangensis]
MRVDLITLYLLAIGTLLASSALTLWERRSYPRRRRELGVLAAGYATLALGCAAASMRHGVPGLPGVVGAAVSNLIIVGGYLLNLQGVALLNGRRYGRFAVGILSMLALAWAIAGKRGEAVMWAYISAIPIAVVCGLTARGLLGTQDSKWKQSRNIAVAVTGGHALFYAFRAAILPWLAASFGPQLLAIAGQATMYEGVLYSVVLPMTLLRLARDEAHADLRRESQTDYLTGLGNRRWFFEEGARVIRESDAFPPASCLALDLDRFKAINDRFGHEAGDDVLKSFAKILRSVLGRDVILARIGGEEFAALLPGHESARAKDLAEAVVRRFAQTVTRTAGGVEIEATVSIGMARIGTDEDTLEKVLAAADRALYSAKSRGGNRLEIARAATARANLDDAPDRRLTAL